MKPNLRGTLPLTAAILTVLIACSPKEKGGDSNNFTAIDSLTETYLTLEDSVMNSWNAIAGDESEKIRSLNDLLHALIATHRHDESQLNSLEQRLDQLEEQQIDHENMADQHTIEEYDFASKSLVAEIVSEAESDAEYASDTELQQLVNKVKIADQRIPIFRADYDSAASRFNSFLEENKLELDKLDASLSREMKPLF